MRRRSAVWVLAGALLLTGCAGGVVPVPTDRSDPSISPAPEPSGASASPVRPSPTSSVCPPAAGDSSGTPACDPVPAGPPPTPTVAAPTGKPVPLSSLVLSTEGLGRYRWGTSFPTAAPASDPIVWFPGYCRSFDWAEHDDLWATAYETWRTSEPYWDQDAEGNWFADWGTGYWRGPFGFNFVPGTTRLALVELRDPSMATSRGIHVGSTVDALRRAYPGAEWHSLGGDFADTGTYVVRTASGSLHFAVSDANPWTGDRGEATVWQIFGSADPDEAPMSTLFGDSNYMLACVYA